MNNNIFDNLGDTKQAAELWGLNHATVKHYCQQGIINAKKFGNSWVVDLTQPNPSYFNNVKEGELTFTGIKGAVSDFNNCLGAITIYLNTNNNLVFPIFPNSRFTKENFSDCVYEVIKKTNETGQEKITMAQLHKKCLDVINTEN